MIDNDDKSICEAFCNAIDKKNLTNNVNIKSKCTTKISKIPSFDIYIVNTFNLSDTNSRLLVMKIYKANPKVFMDVESVRTLVRYYTGKQGVKNRPKAKEFAQPVTYDSNPFKLPESYAETFEPYIISQSKTLIISDLHFPYQDNKAITAAIKYG